jgi:Flp pilus assembly protein TadD
VWFQKAFQIDPMDVNICGNVANALLAAGQLEGALSRGEKALELDRYNASAWMVKVQIQAEREPCLDIG